MDDNNVGVQNKAAKQAQTAGENRPLAASLREVVGARMPDVWCCMTFDFDSNFTFKLVIYNTSQRKRWKRLNKCTIYIHF